MTNSNASEVEGTLKYSNCSVDNKSAEQSKVSDRENLTEISMCTKTLESVAHSKHLRIKKSLNDLDLMDSFLFSAITERVQDAE